MKEKNIFALIHSMDQITNHLIIQWNKMFKENLGISHILVLGHLKENGKSRPSDIARALGVTPPTLTHLSEKLVQKKLATRLVDEDDRRIIYLEITEKGIDIVKEAHEEGKTIRKNLFEKLTDEERQQLLSIYEKLNNSI
ncbi:MarR family winged helix-turn-helix transcriptional regulator [Metabacillus fastidiosus]|uniref:MarR family transcriptional regulator n=2 Tax=Metabacillus fastidiosus TaxID=1458 RepID=A0ABU6NWE7_9BACI|nr:MarR family transcriptional regulator [Metabacillus fastidiosus]MEC2075810.1 MarR family transcriptional regulator [Metabacillus fastidiosus]MED4400599.1 MarR family transcriptional regulator [Metabacillus fastidiosus]MED4455826.1 MarR family transcriptional regulator [Metabacillus fastidiosus]MED4464506.1 MarR family transcriptional regulator [Metabacillus fastidiosus]